MSEEVYHRLARRLDAIPNGFPTTESGVELLLLAKIFTPEQAALAAEMLMRYEPAEAIADRAGADPQEARQVLKGMARSGLIRARRGGDALVFALLPFVVGIYEEQLPRMDEEFATLVERYFQETGMRTILDTPPPIHRVIPVEETISLDLEVFPYERAAALVEGARSWGVRNCICRVQQRLVGKGCDYPLESCLLLAPVEGAFVRDEVTRAITKEEALQILQEAEEVGLVHSTGNYRDRHNYICNCCPCCCGVLRGLTEFGVPTAVARSGFYAAVDEAACQGCGTCVERCPFEAITLPEETAVVDLDRCLGCGVCAPTCPAEAIHLERRATEETPPPTDIKEWALRRAQARGIRSERTL
jgi:electron transport complex protein RnfB